MVCRAETAHAADVDAQRAQPFHHELHVAAGVGESGGGCNARDDRQAPRPRSGLNPACLISGPSRNSNTTFFVFVTLLPVRES